MPSGRYPASTRFPEGDLAVTAPWGFGHTHLVPVAVDFLSDYPEISLRLDLTDRVVNTAEEDIDIAIRVGVSRTAP